MGLCDCKNPFYWKTLKHLLPAKSEVAQVKHHAAVSYREIPTLMAGLRERTSLSAGALEAAQIAGIYAFHLIEHDGEDMRNRPFLDRKAALARLLRNTEAGIRFNEHIPEDGPVVFADACRLGAEGIVSKNVDSTYRSGPCGVWIKVGNPASIAVQRERSEIWNRWPRGGARQMRTGHTERR
jgi:hypothetical protein